MGILIYLKTARGEDTGNWRKIDGAGSQKGVRMVFEDRRRKYVFKDEGSRGLQIQINFYLSRKLREFTLSFSFLYKM